MMAHASILTSQSPPTAPATANQQQAAQPQVAAAASQSISSQPATISNTNNNNNNSSSNNNNNNNNSNTNNNNNNSTSLPSPRTINCTVPAGTDFLRHTAPPPAFRPAPDFTPSFFTNGHGAAAAAALFRPGFPGYQHPAHHHASVLTHAQITANNGPTNGEFGPTDLSMKKSNSKGQLSPSEVTAIKQLIAGYKESASFLYRSADELEQLLLQQN
ncbi:nucleolar protein 4 [Elysia marginata]|uniref:Nucleolar protein 4 n=1 Tax=Elysia marginata TaxID=1093978 RepID=A0AAV4HAZ8_9GAST|nr:nucleolar protein 4 [Elysia marginata]